MTARDDRARARAHWAARLVTGSDPGEEARHDLSPDEAWLAVIRLTRSLWSLTGGEDVVLPRAEWPAQLFHRGEVRDDGSQSRG